MKSGRGSDTVTFERTRFLPLAGAKVRLLSKRAVEKFLCMEGGQPVGTMIGFDFPLTASLENLVRYHAGIFGFTGAGKSNLTSTLLRKVMATQDVSVVVFDIAGEYATHLIDVLGKNGRILSQEPIEDEEQLLNSQALPESVEGQGSEALKMEFSRLFEQGRVKRLAVGGGPRVLDLASVEGLLSGTVEEGRTGAIAAKIALEDFTKKFYAEMELQPNTRLTEMGDEAKGGLLELLDSLKKRVNERTALASEVGAIADYLESRKGQEGTAEPVKEKEKEKEITAESLAADLAYEKAPLLNILYVPDPERARMTAHALITRLLSLRKKVGSKRRVLIVLDEAQEYIPDMTRERDQTFYSNLAVEALLRQGRKYKIHCWLATQRVAHLNVSALQQLHSYFVSTLPRFYDRMVVAESFGLPYEVLERSAQLDTGEWIFVSFKATKQRNVPVFLKTENNDAFVSEYLSQASKRT